MEMKMKDEELISQFWKWVVAQEAEQLGADELLRLVRDDIERWLILQEGDVLGSNLTPATA